MARRTRSFTGSADAATGRLWQLFQEIEEEFNVLRVENIELAERVAMLEAEREHAWSYQPSQRSSSATTARDLDPNSSVVDEREDKKSRRRVRRKMRQVYEAVGTNRIVSSMFKHEQTFEVEETGRFEGHSDGVWAVRADRWDNKPTMLGTASADQTARLWDLATRECVAMYSGHTGSVNSVDFHPAAKLICTASGDQEVHVWAPQNEPSRRSSEVATRLLTERGLQELAEQQAAADDANMLSMAKVRLVGHKGVVSAATWMQDGSQIASASWDRTARLWDANTGQSILELSGHDLEVTGVCSHPVDQMVVTSSRDATFRLWDLRSSSISEVNVFQGHTDTVACAIFTQASQLVTASDDRTVKVWDVRNMRTATATIRTDSGPNWVSLSPNKTTIAVALDHRNVKLFDLSGGTRLARVPRRGRKGHARTVTCVDWTSNETIASCSFDKSVIHWRVTAR